MILALIPVKITRAVAEEVNRVGILMPYLSPDQPLRDGAGLMFTYSRTWDKAASQLNNVATTVTIRHAPVFSVGLASVKVVRDQDGILMPGEVILRYPSVGFAESWSFSGGKWILSAGGGVDYFIPDAEGDFSLGSPIGISNDYDVDSGFGLYTEVEMERSLGAGWELVFGVGYLFASLDGHQTFVVSGVSGNSMSADFDLTGLQANLGIAYRF